MNIKYYSTSKNPLRAIIALHGWTGNVNSMKPVAKTLSLKETKWLIPEAPYLASGKGFSWFEGNDEVGWKCEESFEILKNIIKTLREEGFTYNQIFIIGFSQGACLSMEYIIRQKFSLGGILPISGFLKYKNRAKTDFEKESSKTPILFLHGDLDKIVYPKESNFSFKIFKELGYKVKLEIFSGGHKIPLQARPIIQKFILEQLLFI